MNEEVETNSLLGIPQFLRQKFLSATTLPKELEKKVDEGIQRALTLLNIPTREEVQELQSRVERLLKRCEALDRPVKTAKGETKAL